jgi:hypothetical protein
MRNTNLLALVMSIFMASLLAAIAWGLRIIASNHELGLAAGTSA